LLVGGIGEQSPSEVLQAHGRRAATTGRRDQRVEAHCGRDRVRPAGHLTKRHDTGAGVMSPFRRTPSRVRSALRNLFTRSRVERELDADVRAYAELLADEKVRAGMDRSAAKRAALVELGGIECIKDEVREVRTGALLETTARDVRYAVRTL